MRRTIFGLFAASLVGFLASNASAGHHKKAAACAPAPTACETVIVAPAPVACAAPAKKCHAFKMPKFKMPKLGCHKKAAVCAPTTSVCESGPAFYPAQQSYGASQSYSAPQSFGASQR